jgi:PII-like signaling protein
MVKISGPARRLRIYIGEASKHKGVSVYHAIVLKAKELGLAGASVFRGVEGFGANSRIKTSRILELSNDLPLVIDIVDSAEYIDKLMPFLDDVVQEGLITIEDIHIIKYTAKRKDE